jgi:hypothetical protein
VKGQRFVVVTDEEQSVWSVWDVLGECQVGFKLQSGRVAFGSPDRRMIENIADHMNKEINYGHSELR